MLQRLDDIFRNHTFRYPQFLRDLPVGFSVQTIHQQGTPALRGEFPDSAFQSDESLFRVQGILCGRRKAGGILGRRIGAERFPANTDFAEIVDGEIRGHSEEEGPRVLHVDGRAHADEMHIGFLRAIGGQFPAPKLVSKEPQQVIVVLFEGRQARDGLFMVHG